MKCYIQLRMPIKDSIDVMRIVRKYRIVYKKLLNDDLSYEIEIKNPIIRRLLYDSNEVIDFIIDRDRSVAL